jgi:hypothetical protein
MLLAKFEEFYRAEYTMSMIQKLYRIEISLKDKSEEEKYQLRQEKPNYCLSSLVTG